MTALNALNEQDVIPLLASMSKGQLLEYVMGLHSVITIQVVIENIKQDLFEQTVKFLDKIYRANKLKSNDQIDDKDFHNEAINNSIDLKP